MTGRPYTALRTLPVGARFQYPDSGRVGRVLRQGDMGTVVKYEGQEREVSFGEVHFIRASEPVTVSGGSAVWPLGEEETP